MRHLDDIELLDALDGCRPPPRHLSDCDFCAARLRMLARGDALIRSVENDEARDVWPAFRAELRPSDRRRYRWLPLAAAASLAAVSVFVARDFDAGGERQASAEIDRARDLTVVLLARAQLTEIDIQLESETEAAAVARLLRQRTLILRQIESLRSGPDATGIRI